MPFSRKKPEIQGGLSGTALKYIAMTTMLADHIGAVLLERIVYYRGNLEQVAMLMTSQWGDTLYWLWRMLRTVGGLHFPFTAFTGGGIPSYKGLAQILAQDGCVCAYLRNSFPPGCVEYVGRGSSNVYVELAIGLLVLRGLNRARA